MHVSSLSSLLILGRWPTDGLIERVNERIKKQIETVEDMTGDMDPKTNFGLIVIQTELERWKYLVRSFLRARMAKVRFPLRSYPVDTTMTIYDDLADSTSRLTNIPSTIFQLQRSAPDSPNPRLHTQRGIMPSYTTTTSHRS